MPGLQIEGEESFLLRSLSPRLRAHPLKRAGIVDPGSHLLVLVEVPESYVVPRCRIQMEARPGSGPHSRVGQQEIVSGIRMGSKLRVGSPYNRLMGN